MNKPPSILTAILFAATTAYASDNNIKTQPETANESHHTAPFLTLRNKTGSKSQQSQTQRKKLLATAANDSCYANHNR